MGLEADDLAAGLLCYTTDWSRLPPPLSREQREWFRYLGPALEDELRQHTRLTDWLRQLWTCRVGTVGDANRSISGVDDE